VLNDRKSPCKNKGVVATVTNEGKKNTDEGIDTDLLACSRIHERATKNQVRDEARNTNVGGDSNGLITISVQSINTAADVLNEGIGTMAPLDDRRVANTDEGSSRRNHKRASKIDPEGNRNVAGASVCDNSTSFSPPVALAIPVSVALGVRSDDIVVEIDTSLTKLLKMPIKLVDIEPVASGTEGRSHAATDEVNKINDGQDGNEDREVVIVGIIVVASSHEHTTDSDHGEH